MNDMSLIPDIDSLKSEYATLAVEHSVSSCKTSYLLDGRWKVVSAHMAGLREAMRKYVEESGPTVAWPVDFKLALALHGAQERRHARQARANVDERGPDGLCEDDVMGAMRGDPQIATLWYPVYLGAHTWWNDAERWADNVISSGAVDAYWQSRENEFKPQADGTVTVTTE